MITAEEREQAFRKELKELLGKHGAEIEVQDVSETTYRKEWRIVITMNSIYGNDYSTVLKDYAEFQL